MKNISLTHALIAAFLAGNISMSYAQITTSKQIGEGGTNVGGIVGEGSTNVGGSEDGISIYSMNPWNSGVLRTIKKTKQSATDNFADNKLETAIKIYVLQLEKISQTASIPELQLSWTKKIADRTLDLADRLNATIINQDDRIIWCMKYSI